MYITGSLIPLQTRNPLYLYSVPAHRRIEYIGSVNFAVAVHIRTTPVRSTQTFMYLLGNGKVMDYGTRVNAWEKKVPFEAWRREVLKEVKSRDLLRAFTEVEGKENVLVYSP